MGAAGLIEIKRRLKSVQSTRKITNAMGLVATSKLRKCRKELVVNSKYLECAEKTIKSLAAIAGEEIDFPYFKSNDSNKKLYIVISSDAGLCAGYNNNIVSYLESLVGDEKENIKVITVGNKGVTYVKRAGFDTIAEYVDMPDVPTIKEVRVIYEKALKLFIEGQVSEVNIVFTDFVSPIKQVPKCAKVLPVDKIDGDLGGELVEPDFDTVLTDTLDIYLKAKIRNLMLSAKCSEQSARMTAMDGATSNANDLISALNIKYNRIRQTMITQEISEIVGGAETQK